MILNKKQSIFLFLILFITLISSTFISASDVHDVNTTVEQDTVITSTNEEITHNEQTGTIKESTNNVQTNKIDDIGKSVQKEDKVITQETNTTKIITKTENTQTKTASVTTISGTLTSDITLTGDAKISGEIEVNNDVTLNGQGHTITFEKDGNIRPNKGTLTIKNCVFDGTGQGGSYVFRLKSSGGLYVTNCTFKNFNQVKEAIFYEYEGKSPGIYVINCYFYDNTIASDDKYPAYFNVHSSGSVIYSIGNVINGPKPTTVEKGVWYQAESKGTIYSIGDVLNGVVYTSEQKGYHYDKDVSSKAGGDIVFAIGPTISVSATNISLGASTTISFTVKNGTTNLNGQVTYSITDSSGKEVKTGQVTSSSGKASATFTPSSSGQYTVTAKYPYTVYSTTLYAMNTTTFNVSSTSKSTPSLTINPTSVTVGSSSTITFTLQNGTKAVNGEKISYNITRSGTVVVSNTYTGNTNTNGIVTVSYTPTIAGTYTVSAYYEGNNNYNNASSTSTFTATAKNNPTLTVTDITVNVNSQASIQFRLTNGTNRGISGSTITYTINGVSSTTSATDSNGYATGYYTPTSAGKYTISATSSQTTYFNSATSTGTLTANKLQATLTVTPNPTSAYTGQDITLTFTLKDSNNNNINNAKINYTINSGSTKTTGTTSNGRVTATENHNTHGTYNVRATYNTTVYEATATTSYNVQAKSTPTLTINTPNSATLGTPTDIEFRLYNGTNPLSGEISYTIGTTTGTTTINGGSKTISYTPTSTGEITVTAHYNGDTQYNAVDATSKKFTVANVNKANTDLVVSVENARVNYNTVNTVYFTLTSDDNPVNGVVVYYNVTDADGCNVLVNKQVQIVSGGSASVPLNFESDGTYTIKAKFNGNDYYYASSGNASYTMGYSGGYASLISVSAPDVLVNTPNTITATITNALAGSRVSYNITNSSGNVVASGTSYIESTGYAYITYTPNKVDTYTVHVNYNGRTNYRNTTKRTSFIAYDANTQLIIDAPDAEVDKNTTITFTLKSGSTPLVCARINYNVTYGTTRKWYSPTKTDAITDENGVYTLIKAPDTAGTWKVNATFGELYNEDTFEVTGKHIVNITIDKSVAYTDSDNIKVVNLTLKRGSSTPYKLLHYNVTTISGSPLITDQTFTPSFLNRNITLPKFTQPGQYIVKAWFEEDDVDYGCVNETVLTVLERTHTNITIELSSTRINVGESNSVIFNLHDNDGNILSNAKVNYTVSLNGNSVKSGNNVNTGTSINLSSLAQGDYKVNVSFIGNNSHYNSANETTFKVANEITNTKLTATSLNNTYGNVTIGGTLTDEDDKPIKEATITIKLPNGDTYTATTDSNGKYNKTLPLNVGQTYDIDVVYDGNSEYNGDSKQVSITPQKAESKTIATITSSSTVSTVISINVTALTDDNNFLSGGAIKVYLNDIELKELKIFDASGSIINLNVDGLSEGLHNFYMEYEGNSNYKGSNYTLTDVSVDKVDAIIDASVDDSVVGSTKISGTVSAGDEHVTTGSVKLVVGDKEYDPISFENGEFTFDVDVPVDVTSVTVKYVDNKYAADDKELPVNVQKRNSTTIASIQDNTVGDFTLRVTITDKDDSLKLVKNGKVSIYSISNNREILLASEVLDGTHNYVDITLPQLSTKYNYNLTARFTDNENYTNSEDKLENIQLNKRESITKSEPLNNTFGNTTIKVTVTDKTDSSKPITNGNIIVYDVDEEGNFNEIETVTLTENPIIIKLPELSDGTHNIVVNYTGNENYTGSSDDDSLKDFNVEKLESKTLVEKLNSTENNVTIKVTVADAQNSSQTITSGDIEVYYIDSGIPVTVGTGKLTGSNTTEIKLDLTKATYDLIVEYNGNDNYKPSTNDTELKGFTVTEIPKINTKINLTNLPTLVRANSTANLTVKLLDVEGNPVKADNIEVDIKYTSGDKAVIYHDTVFTDENGIAIVNYYVPVNGTYNINVTFPGNSNYNGNNSLLRSLRVNTQTILNRVNVTHENGTVEVNKLGNGIITVKAGEIIGIKIALFDTNRNPVIYGTGVNLKVSDVLMDLESINWPSTEIIFDDYDVEINGNIVNIKNYSFEKVGEFDHEIEFLMTYPNVWFAGPGIFFKVIPRDSIVNVDLDNLVVGKTSIINVSLTSPERLGEVIKNMPVTLNLTDNDGNVIAELTGTTDDNGIAHIEYKPTGVYETINYKAGFTDDEVYASNSTTGTTQITKKNYILNASVSNNTFDNVTISGNLTEDDGTHVVDAEINITLPNGENVTVKTDENGNYNKTISLTPNDEKYTVNVTYIDEDTGDKHVKPVDVTVIKAESKTIAAITSSTTVSTVISINVTALVDDSNFLSGGAIKVYLNDSDLKELKEFEATSSIINLEIIGLSDGKHNFYIEYEGNANYTNSNCTLTDVNVDKVDAVIDASVDDSVVGSTKISGTVSAGDEPVTTGSVKLVVGTKEYNPVSFENGEFLFDVDVPVDVTSVTVKYIDSKYAADDKELQVTVQKRNSTITARLINNTQENTTICVEVVDTDNKSPITDGVIKVYSIDNDLEILVGNATLNGTNTADIKLPELYAKYTYDLKVLFTENKNYNDNSTTEALTDLKILKRESNTNAELTDKTLGDVTIKVTVTDHEDLSKVITGGSIIVYEVSDEGIVTVIDEVELSENPVEVKLSDIEVGVHNIIVNYTGNEVYKESSDDDSLKDLNVEKRESLTQATLTNSLVEQVKVKVTISDKNDKNKLVTDGDIEIYYIDGGKKIIAGKGSLNGLNTTEIALDNIKTGTFNLIVLYKGNDKYKSSTNDSALKNSEIKSHSVNIIVNNINTTVGNVTVQFNVTDESNNPVTEDNITIFDKDGNIIANTTIKDGLTNITIPDISAGYNNLSAKYNSSGNYADQTVPLNIKVEPHNTTISLNPIKDVTIGKTVTITGELHDETGKPVNNTIVKLTINGNEQTITTQNNGKFKYSFTTDKTGQNNITVKYDTNNKNYTSSKENKTSFTVNKHTTKLDVETTSTPTNTTLTVNVTDENKNPVKEGTVTVTLPNGTTETKPVQDGKAVITVPTNPGKQNITITYNGNDNNNKTNKTIQVTGKKHTTNSTINPIEKTTIGKQVTIKGTLKDTTNNTIIKNAPLSITLPDGTIKQVSTNSNGEYALTITTDKIGNNSITVKYNGNATFESASNKTIFVVEKRTPQVGANVTVSPNNIMVNLSVTDEEGNKLSEGNVTVVLDNGTNRTVPVKNGTANITLPVTPGNHNITINYDGGNNNSNATGTFNVTIPKHDTTTKVTTSNTTPNSTIVHVNITDELGRKVNNGTVVVTLPDGTKVNGIVKNGSVSLTVPVSPGKNSITVDYVGDSNYNPSKATVTVNVPKHNSTAKITASNTTPNSTVVKVNVTDESGKPVTNGAVVVTLPNGTKVNSTVKNGTANITVPVNPGKNNITVEYKGDNNTNPTKTTVIVDVPKHNTTTKVIAGNTTPDSTTVKVNINDETGKPINNGTVIVTLSNGTKVNASVKNGTTSVSVPVNPGKTNLTVEYKGDNNNNPSKATLTVNVPKHNTTTKVTASNTTPNSTVVKVSVTDESGKPVNNGTVTVTLSNGTKVNGAVKNGVASVIVPVAPGKNKLTVEYKGNAFNNPSNATVTVDVPKHNSTAKVNVTTTPNNVTVKVSVADESGKPVTNGTVTVSLPNGTKVNSTVKNGTVTITIPVTSGKNNITVEYKGDNSTNPTKTTVIVDVPKHNTTTKVGASDVTPNSTTFKVNVADESGKPVNNGTVVVTLSNGTKVNAYVKNGTASVLVPVNPGKTNLTVEYKGDNNYNPSKATLTVNVPKHNTTTKVTASNTTPNSTVVKVSVADESGKPVNNGTVIVSLPDGTKVNGIVKNGSVSLTVPVSPGKNKLVIEYKGDNNNNPSNATVTVNVPKHNSTAKVNVTTTPNNVTVKVIVTDESGRPVTNGTVTVSLPNGTNKTVNVVNGKANVTVPVSPGVQNITIKYNGDNNNSQVNKTVSVTVPAHTTGISINISKTVTVGDKTTVSGVLTDLDTHKVLANAGVEVSVNGKVVGTVKTNSKGVYSTSIATDIVGSNNVTVKFKGNGTHKASSNNTKFTVNKLNVTANVSVTNNKSGEVTLKVNLTDSKNKSLSSGTVTVKDSTGKVVGTATVSKGIATVKLNSTVAGKQNFTVSYLGDANHTALTKVITATVDKKATTLTVNTIKTPTVGDKVKVTGVLKDENNKVIAKAPVNIIVDGEKIATVTTDKNGIYTYTLMVNKTATTNITPKYGGNNTYKTSTVKTNFTANKAATIVTVEPIYGIIGDNITFIAHVTDLKGNLVSGGNLVFKLNGKTMRVDNTFYSNATSQKFGVQNGLVKVSIKADKFIRDAKNVSASYSGTSNYYENSTENITTAEIAKRRANLTVTITPSETKQYDTIRFTVNVYDVTHNEKNVKVYNHEDSFVFFKINGVTLKDKQGNQIKVKVNNGVAIYDYKIPAGMSGVSVGGKIRYYTVTAGFSHQDYYPDSKANATFHVERSNITFSIKKIVANMTSKKLTVQGNIKDYKNNNVIGTNKINVKINGKTLTSNNKTVVITIKEGVMNFTVDFPTSIAVIRSIEFVAGERVSYLSARLTTTELITVK